MLLTYHQVTPSFLDLVFTFRYRERPLDHALFRSENFLESSDLPLCLPAMGRSGVQLQHSFNLLTVERAEAPLEKQQWPLRHASVYHSFDVMTGRSVNILLKGNRNLAMRIVDATKTHRHLSASAPRTPEQAFVGSLRVHLIVLEWAAENWREYIDDLDDMLRSSCENARVAPVVDVTSGFAAPFSPRGAGFFRPPPLRTVGSRQGAFRTAGSRDNTIYREASQSDVCNPVDSEAQSSAVPRRIGYQMVMGFLRRLFGLESKPKQGHTEIAEDPDESIQRLDAPES